MSDAELEQWLTAIGMQQYLPNFVENGYDFSMVPSLEKDDLTDIGITMVGHRKKILMAATKGAPSAPATTATPAVASTVAAAAAAATPAADPSPAVVQPPAPSKPTATPPAKPTNAPPAKPTGAPPAKPAAVATPVTSIDPTSGAERPTTMTRAAPPKAEDVSTAFSFDAIDALMVDLDSELSTITKAKTEKQTSKARLLERNQSLEESITAKAPPVSIAAAADVSVAATPSAATAPPAKKSAKPPPPVRSPNTKTTAPLKKAKPTPSAGGIPVTETHSTSAETVPRPTLADMVTEEKPKAVPPPKKPAKPPVPRPDVPTPTEDSTSTETATPAAKPPPPMRATDTKVQKPTKAPPPKPMLPPPKKPTPPARAVPPAHEQQATEPVNATLTPTSATEVATEAASSTSTTSTSIPSTHTTEEPAADTTGALVSNTAPPSVVATVPPRKAPPPMPSRQAPEASEATPTAAAKPVPVKRKEPPKTPVVPVPRTPVAPSAPVVPVATPETPQADTDDVSGVKSPVVAPRKPPPRHQDDGAVASKATPTPVAPMKRAATQGKIVGTTTTAAGAAMAAAAAAFAAKKKGDSSEPGSDDDDNNDEEEEAAAAAAAAEQEKEEAAVQPKAKPHLPPRRHSLLARELKEVQKERGDQRGSEAISDGDETEGGVGGSEGQAEEGEAGDGEGEEDEDTAPLADPMRHSILDEDIAVPKIAEDEKERLMQDAIRRMEAANMVSLPVEVYYEPMHGAKAITVNSMTTVDELSDSFQAEANLEPVVGAGWGVYEVWAEPPIERRLAGEEKVLDVVNSWPRHMPTAMCKLEVRPVVPLDLTMAACSSMPTMESMMNKGGGKHNKSWKQRYFKLLPDGIHYFKEDLSKRPNATALGCFNYGTALLYYVRQYKKAPGKFFFCIKQAQCEREAAPGRAWPSGRADVLEEYEDRCKFMSCDDWDLRERWMNALLVAQRYVATKKGTSEEVVDASEGTVGAEEDEDDDADQSSTA